MSNVWSGAPKWLAWTGDPPVGRWRRSWFGMAGVLLGPPKWLGWANLC